MTNPKSNSIFILFSLLTLQLQAQFRYTAPLGPVKETGFYAIPVTPELGRYLKTGLGDLRITDDKKQPVPYLIQRPAANNNAQNILHDQPILTKSSTGSATVLVIENARKEKLSDLVIELKNATAERTGSLSGSDNNRDWFVILDSLSLSSSGNREADTTHRQYIRFPASTYRYFKLTINNNNKAPLNILKAMSLAATVTDSINRYMMNPHPTFQQQDDKSYSLITLTYHDSAAYQADYLQIFVAAPGLYQRNAKIFTYIKESLAATWSGPGLCRISLSSDRFSGYAIPLIKADTLYLLIENGDNPPLQVSSVATGASRREIVAQLEKDKTYTLLLDDVNAAAPVYDLQHFRDRITGYSSLHAGKISALPGNGQEITNKKPVSRKWIWPVILVVIALLSFLTWKLTVDMKRKITN